MGLEFYKYQGTGNDFVMIDNRSGRFPSNDQEYIAQVCDRRFGIGADGLILLEASELFDFKMVYFNADGKEGTMCGNGGRCLVAFAKFLGLTSETIIFSAIDGKHVATIDDTLVSLQMQDVKEVQMKEDHVFLDTGSPHHVLMVDDLKTLNVKEKGAAIRYGVYGEEGSNVNFVNQIAENEFTIRTYERGVEDETLSCGTGATAVAIAMHKIGRTSAKEVIINVEGGVLNISFEITDKGYKNVFLKGKAIQVFKGELS